MLSRVSGIAVVAVFSVLAPLAADSVRTTARLNLRQEPSTSSARLQLLEVGRTLEIIHRRGLWVRVKAGQLEGWVHSDYVVDTAHAPAAEGREIVPSRIARDATLARDVALLRVRKLESELATLRSPETSELVDELAGSEGAVAEDAEQSTLRAERLAEQGAAIADLAAERDDLRQLVAHLRGEPGGSLAGAENAADHQAEVEAQLRLELEQATTDIAGREATIDGLEQQLAAGAAELEQLAASKAESQQRATERLRQQELREQEHNAALAAQLALAQTAAAEHDPLIERQRVAAGELTDRLSVAEAASEQLTVERDALVGRVQELEAGIVRSDQRLGEGTRAIESLRDRLQTAATTNSEFESRLTALAGAAGERDQRVSQVADLEHELSAARDTLAIRDTSLRAADTSVEQLEKRLAGLVTVAGERDQVAERLAELESEISADRTAAEQQARALAAAIDQLSSARSSAASDQQAATAGIASVAAERDRLAASERQLHAELQAAGERAGEQERATTASLASLRSELAAARAEGASGAQETAERLAAARATLDVVRAERDRIATTADDYASEGKRYATALFELQDWSDQAEAELARLGAEVEVRKAKHSRRQEPLREQLASVQGELETARTALEAERQARVSAMAVADELRAGLAETRTRESTVDRRLPEADVEDAAQWQQQAQQAVATVAELRRRLAVVTSELTGLRQREGSRPAASPVPVPVRELRPDPGLRVVEAVERWARAWSQQDVSGYLEAYASDYRPASGLDHGTWARQRRERLTQPRFIDVELNRMEVNVIDTRHASVEFEQSYRSDGFGDRVMKTLELVRVDGAWKIVSEVSR